MLVLSAYPEEEFAIRSFKLGASAYLNKSRASDELLAAVKKVVTGGKYVTPSLAEKLAIAVGAGIGQAPHESLSRRELQVLCMIASGKTIKGGRRGTCAEREDRWHLPHPHFAEDGFGDKCRVDALRLATSARGLAAH